MEYNKKTCIQEFTGDDLVNVKRNGLSNITINQYGQAENWEGTLIIAGNK